MSQAVGGMRTLSHEKKNSDPTLIFEEVSLFVDHTGRSRDGLCFKSMNLEQK